MANRPKAAHPPYCEDLWFLYRWVKRHKPECVLEFGAGCSTVVLAQALYENGSGHLYSIDGSEYWAQTTWELMPAHLHGVTTLTYSGVVPAEVEGEKVLRHVKVPDVSPDLIFLDGPDFDQYKFGGIPAACDPLDLEPRFKPGFRMIVDGRMENTEFLRKHLKRRYRVFHRWPQEPWETTVFDLR